MLQFSGQPYRHEVNSVPSTPYLFDQTPPNAALRVAVVVPVKNEEAHLQRTLDALRNQQSSQGVALPYEVYEVLLLTNNCTDQSYGVARQYQQRFPEFSLHIADIWLTPDKANIGHVRRLLMDEACRRLLLTGNRPGIIASTDGDTVVDSQWISQTMAEIEKGNDAVGGRILTHRDNPASQASQFAKHALELGAPDTVRRYHLLDVTYRHLVVQAEAVIDPNNNDPWPRHFQHFAASLAVTCSAYLKAGRLPEAPYLEDEAFYQALLRIDAKVRKSPLVKVYTSTRTQGRVAVGFSWQLDQWSTMSATQQLPLVEGGDVVLTRLRRQKQLRDCWQTMAYRDQRARLATIANELRLDADWLYRETATSQYFGQLYETVEKQLAITTRNQPQPLVPITTAIRELREFLRQG